MRKKTGVFSQLSVLGEVSPLEIPFEFPAPKSVMGSRHIPRLNGALQLLIDPGRQMGALPYVEHLGAEQVTNGDFHDFTFDYPYIGDNIENLNETTFDTFTKWSASGDFSYDAVALNVKYLFTLNQTSQLIQTTINRADAGTNSTKYRFKYLINVTTAPDGDFSLNLKWGSVTVPLSVTTGTHSVEFVSPSNASTSDLIIEATCTTATVGEFTLDTLGLNRVGMVAHWVFDSYYHSQEGTGKTILQDLTANAHDLTASTGFDYQNQMTGSNPAYRNGSAVEFDGIDDYFYIPAANAGALNPGTGDFSVAVFAKLESGLDYVGIIVKKENNTVATPGYQIAVRTTDGYSYVSISDGTNIASIIYNFSSLIDDGLYHLFILQRNGDLLEFYVDGSLVSSVDCSLVGSLNNSIDFKVGYAYSNWYIYGYISEPAYFNCALSATEVQELYGKAKGWTWNGVGSIQNDNFRQVISGGGTLTQDITTLDNTLYKEKLTNTTGDSINYFGETTSHTVTLGDGTWTQASVKPVENVSEPSSTITDYSGNGNNGTAQGGLELAQPVHPYALELDGIDDYVDFGNVLDVSSNSAIFPFWFKTSGTSQCILSKWNGAAGYSVELSATGRLSVSVSDSVTMLTTIDDGQVFNDNNWHLGIIVIDRMSNLIKRYYVDVNGNVVNTGTNLDISAISTFTTTAKFFVGARNNTTTDYYFNGKLGIVPPYIFDGQNGRPASLLSNYEQLIKYIYDITSYVKLRG